MNITGIRIPVDLDEPLERREIEMGDIKEYQLIVGGMFDVIDFEHQPASVFFNDEGKIIGLPMNERATLLLWVHAPRFKGHDFVAGDALLLGVPDDEGDTQSVPESYLKLLLDTKLYRIEVQVGTSDEWCGNQMVFVDWPSAYGYAIDLSTRWTSVVRTRVVSG